MSKVGSHLLNVVNIYCSKCVKTQTIKQKLGAWSFKNQTSHATELKYFSIRPLYHAFKFLLTGIKSRLTLYLHKTGVPNKRDQTCVCDITVPNIGSSLRVRLTMNRVSRVVGLRGKVSGHSSPARVHLLMARFFNNKIQDCFELKILTELIQIQIQVIYYTVIIVTSRSTNSIVISTVL